MNDSPQLPEKPKAAIAEIPFTASQRMWRFARAATRRTMAWAEHLPRGVRPVVGVALIIGGVFGILPVLGFWMIPAGLAVLSLDFPPLHRRVLRWLNEES